MFSLLGRFWNWVFPEAEEEKKMEKEAKKLDVPEAQRPLKVHPKRQCRFWND